MYLFLSTYDINLYSVKKLIFLYVYLYYTITVLGRVEYPKLSTPLGLFPSG